MSDYPAINARGTVTQFPYIETDKFNTAVGTMDCGKRYSSYLQANPFKTFTLNYAAISDAECAVVEAFFALMLGRYGEFRFTDDAGVAHPKCRFDSDELDITYVSPGVKSLKVVIQEYA